MTMKQVKFGIIFLSCSFSLLFSMQGKAQQTKYHKHIVKEGVRIDFTVSHLDAQKSNSEFKEGDDVLFQFKIKDTISNKPLTGSFPAAWMDEINPNQDVSCGKKIVSYIEAGFQHRPKLDLNKYYVLTLNHDNTINVVDPLFGYGGSQLLNQLQLNGTGYDWVIKEDQSMICVSVPQASEVTFIDTTDLSVDTHVTIPGRPRDIVFQNDERYAWVGYASMGRFEGNSGVAVIDTKTKSLVKAIETGRGDHKVIMDQDDRFAYVSNSYDGTVSVIDMKTLTKKSDIKIYGTPFSMDFSSKANALYVVNKEQSAIYVINATTNEVLGKIPCSKGVEKISFAPDGRLGFITNPKENTVLILDAASNRIIQQADVEESPDEVSFSDELAYVRHLKDDTIWMIPLDILGAENGKVSIIDFTGGQNPPALGSAPVAANGIVQAPGDNAVLVSNYMDNAIYYYREGMAAPSGQFKTYGKKPKAVLAVDKSIEEVSLGTYQTTARLPEPGNYDISLFLDTPSFMECFDFEVKVDEKKEKARLEKSLGSLIVTYMTLESAQPKVGQSVSITFELKESKTNETVKGLKDVRLMTMDSYGKGNKNFVAVETETKGVYSAELKFNNQGIHYIYVGCESKGLSFNNPQFLVLQALKN